MTVPVRQLRFNKNSNKDYDTNEAHKQLLNNRQSVTIARRHACISSIDSCALRIPDITAPVANTSSQLNESMNRYKGILDTNDNHTDTSVHEMQHSSAYD